MLGLALALPGVRRVNSLDAAAATYIAAMTSAPSAARQTVINDLFVGLRQDGLLSKLTHLYLLAAHDAQAARLNAINPGTNNLSAFNSPTFTTDRGYQGDGSTSYLDTGTAYFTGSEANTSTLGIWSRTAAQGSSADFGNGNSHLNCRTTGDQVQHAISASTAGLSAATVTDGSGHFVTVRSSSVGTTNIPYRNGAALGVSSAPSNTSAPNSGNIRILSRSVALTFSTRQIAAFHMSKVALTAQEVLSLYNRLNTYLTAVGAA